MRNAAFIGTIFATSMIVSTQALAVPDARTAGNMALVTSNFGSAVSDRLTERVDNQIVVADKSAGNGSKKPKNVNKLKPKEPNKDTRKGLFKKNEMREKTLNSGQTPEVEGAAANTGLKSRDGKPVKLRGQ